MSPAKRVFPILARFASTLLVLSWLLLTTACGGNPREYAVFQFVAGEVYVLKGGREDLRQRAEIGDTAGPQDVIQTLPESAAELEVRGMGTIRIGEKSILKLEELKTGRRLQIHLESGRAGFLIKKLDPRARVRVSSPTIVASVRGTRFLVGADPQISKVAMFEGALELHAGDRQSSDSVPTAPDNAPGTAPTIVLDRPGEVRLAPGKKLSPGSVQPLSAQSIAEMKALEEMTSPGGIGRPDADMLPSGAHTVMPQAEPLPLPDK